MKYFAQAKPGNDINELDEVAVSGKNSNGVGATLGADMTITGNIVCESPARIFGRVIGDIQATQVLIGAGGHVEGNVTAHEVDITGVFKGTIRGTTVRLRGSASIDGEVFSKSLTVEQDVQFEGISRRLDKPVELPVQIQAQTPTNGIQPLPAAMAN